jgi:hypothetical protein
MYNVLVIAGAVGAGETALIFFDSDLDLPPLKKLANSSCSSLLVLSSPEFSLPPGLDIPK